MKKIFKSLALIIFILAVLIGVYGGFSWYQNRFPKPVGAISEKYSWQYKEKNFNFNETLYQSFDNYYSRKQKGIAENHQEASLKRYLNFPKQDLTISQVTDKLRKTAVKNNFNNDQMVDLVASFVQSLPYDDVRAKTDMTHPRYPYETLFEKTGICSDKTLLTVAILKQLGYGTAVFMYEKDQHMAAAVECPKQYSNYNSGYCIVETTSIGPKVGIIPELNTSNLQAVRRSQAQTFETQNNKPTNIKQLSTPEIFVKTLGSIYNGIINTVQNEKEIESISQYLDQQKVTIEQNRNELNNLKSQMKNHFAGKNIENYNNLVPIYNNLAGEINAEINAYNQKVIQYNVLIKE